MPVNIVYSVLSRKYFIKSVLHVKKNPKMFGLLRMAARSRANHFFIFFLNFYVKIFDVQKIKIFKKFKKLSKDFGRI